MSLVNGSLVQSISILASKTPTRCRKPQQTPTSGLFANKKPAQAPLLRSDSVISFFHLIAFLISQGLFFPGKKMMRLGKVGVLG